MGLQKLVPFHLEIFEQKVADLSLWQCPREVGFLFQAVREFYEESFNGF